MRTKRRPVPRQVAAAAVNLLNEVATGQICTAAEATGVRVIVLKGPSVLRLLYKAEQPARQLQDIDLLVRWSELERLEAALEQLGWHYLGINAIGGDRPHCRIWQRPDTGIILELHRSIAGIETDPDRAWEILSRETEAMVIGGSDVEVLRPAARVMHIALHAAQHGAGCERTLADLRVALERIPEREWEAAAGLARRLDAVRAFAAGMQMLPEGNRLVLRLGLDKETSVEVAVRAQGSPPGTEGFARLAGERRLRGKLRFVGRHLLPPAGYMRVWSATARRGSMGLALAYLWRPLWLACRFVPAMRAWRRARRRAESTR